jgi:D-alanyl-D-alanine carboxypeptidase
MIRWQRGALGSWCLAWCLACSGLFSTDLPDWSAEQARAPLDGVKSLDAEAAAALVDEELPAIVLGVVKGDQLVAAGVAGHRILGSPSLATVHDRWHVGSITKSMTGTLLATLILQDGWSWDDTVAAAFPDVQADPAWATVTVRELLSHRAGVPDLGITELLTWRLDSGSPRDVRAAWATDDILPQPPTDTRGNKVYSNAGYMLLGAMMEARTGRSWEDLVTERVFEPLQLSTHGFGAPSQPYQPWMHVRNVGGELAPVEPGIWADNPAALGPAGTVHMSLPDLATYAAEHLAIEQGRATVFTDPLFKRLHVPAEGEDYAAGWVIWDHRDWANGPVIWHNGSNAMAYALIVLLPTQDMAVLCASNAMADGRASEVCLEQVEKLAIAWAD